MDEDTNNMSDDSGGGTEEVEEVDAIIVDDAETMIEKHMVKEKSDKRRKQIEAVALKPIGHEAYPVTDWSLTVIKAKGMSLIYAIETSLSYTLHRRREQSIPAYYISMDSAKLRER